LQRDAAMELMGQTPGAPRKIAARYRTRVGMSGEEEKSEGSVPRNASLPLRYGTGGVLPNDNKLSREAMSKNRWCGESSLNGVEAT